MDIAETDATAKKWVDAFETQLAASGWRKGRDCDITYRWGASNPELLARHAEELTRLAPDVILAHGTPAMIPLQKTHTAIPIVFAAVSDLIGQGFVASISHPGGNITGFSNFDVADADITLFVESSLEVRRQALRDCCLRRLPERLRRGGRRGGGSTGRKNGASARIGVRPDPRPLL